LESRLVSKGGIKNHQDMTTVLGILLSFSSEPDLSHTSILYYYYYLTP
jgi:hypothetical protein